MFGREVTMKLKANAAAELTRISESEIIPILRRQKGFRDETIFIAPERAEAIANSFWEFTPHVVAGLFVYKSLRDHEQGSGSFRSPSVRSQVSSIDV